MGVARLAFTLDGTPAGTETVPRTVSIFCRRLPCSTPFYKKQNPHLTVRVLLLVEAVGVARLAFALDGTPAGTETVPRTVSIFCRRLPCSTPFYKKQNPHLTVRVLLLVEAVGVEPTSRTPLSRALRV